MYEHVLVATDGSEHASRAATHAIDVAATYGATLHVLYVVETRTGFDDAVHRPDEIRENLERIGEKALSEVHERATERGVETVQTMEDGIPAVQILDYIERRDIDFVFLGERGHSAFKTVLLGSTAERVLYETDVPVALV